MEVPLTRMVHSCPSGLMGYQCRLDQHCGLRCSSSTVEDRRAALRIPYPINVGRIFRRREPLVPDGLKVAVDFWLSM
jgi:hypothetical protein